MQGPELAKLANEISMAKEIDVLGRRVAYWEYPSRSKHAPTIIMIHGYRGNHRGLEAIAAGLSDFRIIIPDLPGFGQSDELSNEHTVSNYARWLEAFIQLVANGENPHLVGHSFGTLIVGNYSTKASPKTLTLINPISDFALHGPRLFLTKLANAYYEIAKRLPGKLGDSLLRLKVSVLVMSISMAKTKDRTLRKWIHTQHLDNFSDFKSIRAAVEGYRASISNSLADYASSIKSPVLIIATERDDITSIKRQREVASLYPEANLIEIKAVGHLTHYEAPDQAASAIRDFILEAK